MGNTETYRRAHEAFNRRDWVAVTSNFSANSEYVDEARGVTLKGPDEFADYLRDNWLASFSDAQVTRPSYIDGGAAVVSQYLAAGTNDGPMGAMAATLKPMRLPMCEVMTFNPAGQITGGRLYYDQASVLVQLGHMEPPASS